nr:hypothetical protein [Tanacetum cinerariifolium]
MKFDLEARLMGETLVLNRLLDPLYGDYIELNDLNEPLELRRNQVNSLMPTIEEGDVIDEPMIDIIKTRNNESFDEYPSFCDFDGKIHIDYAYNFRFSCMIVENMDGYQDQDMGDIILGEPFCKASCVEAKRFDGLITIHNGSDNVTYQMARSHLRFKHLSNAQCNKIKSLLKVDLYEMRDYRHKMRSESWSKVKALGANSAMSGSRVSVVWMEVGGEVMRAKVVSRVVVKVVLVMLRGFWVEELALAVMEYDDQGMKYDEGCLQVL